jgi:hypothetical protein
MVKDSKRFPETNGSGYATLKYDAVSDTFRPFAGEAPDFSARCVCRHATCRWCCCW